MTIPTYNYGIYLVTMIHTIHGYKNNLPTLTRITAFILHYKYKLRSNF